MLQRYMNSFGGIIPSPRGEWVKAEDAQAEIERLRAEVKQCALELGEAAKLLQPNYPRVAGIYEEACGRARVAIGLTPCDVEQKGNGA